MYFYNVELHIPTTSDEHGFSLCHSKNIHSIITMYQALCGMLWGVIELKKT